MQVPHQTSLLCALAQANELLLLSSVPDMATNGRMDMDSQNSCYHVRGHSAGEELLRAPYSSSCIPIPGIMTQAS